MFKNVLKIIEKTFYKVVGLGIVAWSVKALIIPGIDYVSKPEVHRSAFLPDPVHAGLFCLFVGLIIIGLGAICVIKRLPD